MGAVYYNPDSRIYDSEWFFSMTLGGGIKVYFSDRVGVRFQGRLLFPLVYSSAGLFCGTGGCSVGMGAGSSILQVDFTAGLIFIL
jgi:hypothetical protein